MDLFDFAKERSPVAPSAFYMPEEGDRVIIPSIGIAGTIDSINQRELFVDHYFPIQVIMDEEYDNSVLIRTNMKDIQKE